MQLAHGGLVRCLAAVHTPWFATLFDTTPSIDSHSRLFRWARPVTRAGVWQRVLSGSFIASLPEAVREGEVRPTVEAWVAKHAARFTASPRAAAGGAAAAGGQAGAVGGSEVQEQRRQQQQEQQQEEEEAVAMLDMVTEAFVVRRR